MDWGLAAGNHPFSPASVSCCFICALASPPCRVTVLMQETGGNLAWTRFQTPLSPEDPIRPHQAASHFPTDLSEHAEGQVGRGGCCRYGCRQTALCRAGSCLKRDWNNSSSRLGASTREPFQRGRWTQTSPILGSSHHGSGSSRTKTECLWVLQSASRRASQQSLAYNFIKTYTGLPIHSTCPRCLQIGFRAQTRPKLRLDFVVGCPVKSVL